MNLCGFLSIFLFDSPWGPPVSCLKSSSAVFSLTLVQKYYIPCLRGLVPKGVNRGTLYLKSVEEGGVHGGTLYLESGEEGGVHGGTLYLKSGEEGSVH